MKFYDRTQYSYLLQIRGYDKLREIIERDYPVFSGFALEDYFHQKFAESGRWTRIGSWWDRKGENELDILAENELDGTHAVCEVKRDKSRIDLAKVRDKLSAFRESTGKWRMVRPEVLALSLEDM